MALKVIGASLRDKPEMFWISAKSRLTRSQPICESHEIQLLERMRLSIDCLPEKVRECFLDLGSFPEDKKIPLDVLINIPGKEAMKIKQTQSATVFESNTSAVSFTLRLSACVSASVSVQLWM